MQWIGGEYVEELLTFDTYTMIQLFALIFLGGLIDSIAGGGGLISLPAYILTGMPMHMALGSNKFSSAFGTTISAINFLRNKKVYVKAIPISAVCALSGSALGAYVALLVSDEVLRWILIAVVPVVAVFVLIKKDFGKEDRSHTLHTRTILLGAGAAALGLGFYDGFFGPGTGTFLIFIFTLALRFDLVTANGNAKIINMCSNIGSLVTFIANGQVLWALAVPAAVFGIAGNLVGSTVAIRRGAKIIKPVLVVVLGILLINIIITA
ncbi:MAG: TSUP family transporter [Defluviitaleaceae bacterium]|nr:TSUP family transporter [Defluviitaleaceae bacterium]